MKLFIDELNKEIYNKNEEVISTFSWDKRQKLYISKVVSSSFSKGYKFFYAKTTEQLIKQIKEKL